MTSKAFLFSIITPWIRDIILFKFSDWFAQYVPGWVPLLVALPRNPVLTLQLIPDEPNPMPALTTVYQAEVQAINLAAKILVQWRVTQQDIVFHVDNQAAIQSLEHTNTRYYRTATTVQMSWYCIYFTPTGKTGEKKKKRSWRQKGQSFSKRKKYSWSALVEIRISSLQDVLFQCHRSYSLLHHKKRT